MSAPQTTLYHGDCLDIMPTLEDESVNAILTDLPYGTTEYAWDIIIPFEPMWKCIKRIVEHNGVFITTSRQPFASKLIMSNLDWFRYEIIWDKKAGTDFAQANKKPITVHENILVFSKGAHTYNRIDDTGYAPYSDKRTTMQSSTLGAHGLTKRGAPIINRTDRAPTTIRTVFPDNRKGLGSSLHPTQKPVALYEYLVRSYTNEGDTVLDIAAGSGTTGVACVNTNRNFIGIELDLKYFEIMQKRIAESKQQTRLFY